MWRLIPKATIQSIFRGHRPLQFIPSRLIATAFFVLALCFTGIAQESSDSTTTLPDTNTSEKGAPQYSLSGTVFNSVTGEPINRALVSANNQRWSMTDSSGHFYFEKLASGVTLVTAEKPGFFNSDQMGVRSGPRTTIILTTNVDDVVVKLVPQALITGRATSVGGEPIEDLQIRLHMRRIFDGRAMWQMAGITQTDEDGQFRVAGLQPGEYCLSVVPESATGFAPPAHRRGYAKVFFPSSPDFASAGMIDLTAGQHFEADFALTEAPLYEISGQVFGLAQEAGLSAVLLDSAGEQLNVLRLRNRQQFIGYVPAGKYTLNVASQAADQQLAATVPVTIAGNVVGLQVALSPDTAIPVEIRADTSVAERKTQSIVQTSVQLHPRGDALDQNGYSSSPTKPGSAISYIHAVKPGTYSVEVQSWGGMYVDSVTSGSTDLQHDPLVVPAGGRVEPIEVMLRDDGGQISGTFQSQESATVLLIPEHGSVDELRATFASGGFAFDQVRPGDYSVLAFDGGDELEYRNPEVLTPYLSRAVHVSVGARQESKVSIEVTHLGR